MGWRFQETVKPDDKKTPRLVFGGFEGWENGGVTTDGQLGVQRSRLGSKAPSSTTTAGASDSHKHGAAKFRTRTKSQADIDIY